MAQLHTGVRAATVARRTRARKTLPAGRVLRMLAIWKQPLFEDGNEQPAHEGQKADHQERQQQAHYGLEIKTGAVDADASLYPVAHAGEHMQHRAFTSEVH